MIRFNICSAHNPITIHNTMYIVNEIFILSATTHIIADATTTDATIFLAFILLNRSTPTAILIIEPIRQIINVMMNLLYKYSRKILKDITSTTASPPAHYFNVANYIIHHLLSLQH